MTATVSITINGEVRAIAPGTTVATLLDQLELPWKFVAVERNRSLVPRREHAGCLLAEGDELEIVTLVGGG
ncbi:MAG: sulfur carrier protein ThiS [Planctomyces sp.]|nr:sulfur carrier protein ThiS [Planctomyces sp.]